MKVIDSEMILMFDCDETLIMHHQGPYKITNPYTGYEIQFDIHKDHVNLLLDNKAKGFTIGVWSAAGVKWAEKVVKMLNLEPHVDFVMCKPLKFVDDKSADEVLGARVYIPFKKRAN